MQWLTAALTAFVVIVPVELPDKTFIATLVLATRYSAWPVWLGVTTAFGIQCVVAVAAGRLLTLLPDLPVKIGAAVLFALGSFILFRGVRRADQEAEQEHYEQRVRDSRTGWRAFTASFLVLFAAEWGDLSQLLSASLVAAGQPPVPVFIGSWVALSAVAAGGVLLGRVVLKRVRLSRIRLVGGIVCAALSVVTVVTAFA